MNNQLRLATLFLFITSTNTFAGSAENFCDSAGQFSFATIHLERNETDGDTEVVMFVKGGDIGMKAFSVVSPTGKIIYAVAAPLEGESLGLREIEIESPEPKNIELVKQAYPEGLYRFDAVTIDGERLCGHHTLSHELPSATTILYPASREIVVPKALTVSWKPVDFATGYILEITNKGNDDAVEVKLPVDGSTTFLLANGWLRANTEYSVSLIVKNAQDNELEVQNTFFTSSAQTRKIISASD